VVLEERAEEMAELSQMVLPRRDNEVYLGRPELQEAAALRD
jgi:hypothetical protein